MSRARRSRWPAATLASLSLLVLAPVLLVFTRQIWERGHPALVSIRGQAALAPRRKVNTYAELHRTISVVFSELDVRWASAE